MRFFGYTYKKGFTLVELLLALVVVAVIAALVVPALTTKYQKTVMQRTYEKYMTNLTEIVGRLPMIENVASFDQTSLYVPVGINGLTKDRLKVSSEKFLKENFKLLEYCGNYYQENFIKDNPCFPDLYMSQNQLPSGVYDVISNDYQNSDLDKWPTFSCAKLRGGAVMCIRPQVLLRSEEEGEGHKDVDSHPETKNITGWIDLNGKKGPNTMGIDMRSFTLPRQRVNLAKNMTSVETSSVNDYEWECTNSSKYVPACCAGWIENDDLWNSASTNVKTKCCNYTQGEDSKWVKYSKCCKLHLPAHETTAECIDPYEDLCKIDNAENWGGSFFKCCNYNFNLGDIDDPELKESCCNVATSKYCGNNKIDPLNPGGGSTGGKTPGGGKIP